jgi:hypothetical protein
MYNPRHVDPLSSVLLVSIHIVILGSDSQFALHSVILQTETIHLKIRLVSHTNPVTNVTVRQRSVGSESEAAYSDDFSN